MMANCIFFLNLQWRILGRDKFCLFLLILNTFYMSNTSRKPCLPMGVSPVGNRKLMGVSHTSVIPTLLMIFCLSQGLKQLKTCRASCLCSWPLTHCSSLVFNLPNHFHPLPNCYVACWPFSCLLCASTQMSSGPAVSKQQ